MVPHDRKHFRTIGSAILGFYDVLMMNRHYKCTDNCSKSKSSAQCDNGGFPHPRDCSKCICPSGYGGKLCNERPSGCGEILKATSSFQTLEDKLDGKDAEDQLNEFQMCNYWIQAPKGSTIEVVVDKYWYANDVDGCPFEGVEIKTQSDVRLTGYRFCSMKNNMTLISTRNIVPVITYASRARVHKTVLRYRIASGGPDVSETTPALTSGPTSRLTSPKSSCKDKNMCTVIMEKWDFCHNAKYSDELRRTLCPKSCGFC